MSYTNLPGYFVNIEDGGLTVQEPDTATRTLILGTASSGVSGGLWRVRRPQAAVTEFGRTGNLIKGMYEALTENAPSVYLMRIGGTRASVSGIGCSAGGGGYTVTPNLRDNTAGTRYAIYYDDSSDLLMVYDNTNAEWVYSNDTSNPIDFGVISVTGSRCSGGGPDIGTVSSPTNMASVSGTGLTYTAGTDGVTPSLMETYEALYDAYELLDFERFDVVVPMDVAIDEVSVADLTAGQITTRDLASVSDYPTPDSQQDVLGKVYVQRYLGTNYFWWDIDNDGTAEIYPSVGSASGTLNIDGDAISAFHEVNFAHQLATFCKDATENFQACLGTIGVKKPSSFGFADIASWVGQLPEYTTNPSTGARTVATSADNGTGLLGMKWLSGSSSFRAGAADGGLIDTDSGFPDGVEQTDQGGSVVDIGKYISVVGAWVIHRNSYDTTGRGYLGSWAAGYAGMVSRLPADSAPTNKATRAVRVPYRLPAAVLDELAGVRVIMLVSKPKGLVVTDAPTAARPASDYTRLTTMKIVSEVVQRTRNAADPFIGEGITTVSQAALDTALEQVLVQLKREGKLQDFRFKLSITPRQAVLGQADVDLLLQPAFELRQITARVSLAAEIV